MSLKSKLLNSPWPRYAVLVVFAVTFGIMAIYSVFVSHSGEKPDGRTLFWVWSAFYSSCLLVMIYGWSKSAALEGVVYCIAILGESVLPGLCIELVSKLDNTAQPALLEVTCHLMLTLMSCTLLLGWGLVLAFEFMKRGGIPWWARGYILLAILSSFAVLFLAIKTPSTFVNMGAVQNNLYLNTVWPPMYDCPMSSARIYLTILTLFVPWVRFRFETHSGNESMESR